MKTFLNQIHPVQDDILEEYLSHWKPYELSRKTIMTAEGETEKYLYYVLEGVQKSYALYNGKAHIMAFTYPPSFTGVPDSFYVQKPSKFFLETITDSKFLRISFDKHMAMVDKHREIETLFRKAVESFLFGLIQRHYELMALPMEERFKTFAKRSPHMFHIASQKDLASYLKIDPTNFSKLLGNIKI